jgi:hypothetical protein
MPNPEAFESIQYLHLLTVGVNFPLSVVYVFEVLFYV